MANSVENALKHLKGTKGALKPSIARFPALDVEQIVDDLSLKERAEECSNLEPEEAKANFADIVEQDIVNFIRERAAVARSEFHTALDTYETRIRDAMVGEDARVKIEAAAEEGLSNFVAQATEDRLFLDLAREKAARICLEFDNFCKSHRRTLFAPIQLSTTELIQGWSWIFFILIVETIANGMFFAQGSEAGLIGGVSEAFFLSLINISLAIVIGLFAVRYIRHRFWFWRITAALTLIASIIAMLALNLLIAHYREAFATSPGLTVPFDEVLIRYMSQPFLLTDARSWMLGLIGVIFNVFAAYKVFNLADPYPGFSKVANRRDQGIDNLAEAGRECIQTLTDHRNESVGEMQAIIDQISSRKGELELAVRNRDRMHKDFSIYLQDLSRIANDIGSFFQTRAGFGSQVSSRAPVDAEITFTDDLPFYTKPQTEVFESALEVMSDSIKRIHEHYRVCNSEIDQAVKVLRGTDASA